MGEPITEDRLDRYLGLETEINNLQEEVAQKKAKAQLPGYMTDNADAEAELRRAEVERRAIRAAIAALPDPWERSVLRLRYIVKDSETGRQHTWAAIATKLYGKDKERHQIAARRLNKVALEHLALIDAEKQ